MGIIARHGQCQMPSILEQLILMAEKRAADRGSVDHYRKLHDTEQKYNVDDVKEANGIPSLSRSSSCINFFSAKFRDIMAQLMQFGYSEQETVAGVKAAINKLDINEI